ncbi:MAG TPA: hypothetical protein PLQ85_10055 [Anaerolineae bacterium]|nr:hypothetical protein [Anaerolineae bacterium]
MSTPTRTQIAADFSLWGQYVDADATMTRAEFDSMSMAEKLQLQQDAFGAETVGDAHEPATKFFEVSIQPAWSGFGEYQTSAANGEGYEDAEDILAEYDGPGTRYELGVDNLPDDVEDIRGRIHNEPARVFALQHGDGGEGSGVMYFGIVARS